MLGKQWQNIGNSMCLPIKKTPPNANIGNSMAVHGQLHGFANKKTHGMPIIGKNSGYTLATTWARQRNPHEMPIRVKQWRLMGNEVG